jgi:hypothetical protein
MAMPSVRDTETGQAHTAHPESGAVDCGRRHATLAETGDSLTLLKMMDRPQNDR